MDARGQPRMVSIEATVTRADGTVEHLGTIGYWHASWWRRLAWRVRRLMATVYRTRR